MKGSASNRKYLWRCCWYWWWWWYIQLIGSLDGNWIIEYNGTNIVQIIPNNANNGKKLHIIRRWYIRWWFIRMQLLLWINYSSSHDVTQSSSFKVGSLVMTDAHCPKISMRGYCHKNFIMCMECLMRGVLFNTNWIIRLLQLMDEDGNLLASFVRGLISPGVQITIYLG